MDIVIHGVTTILRNETIAAACKAYVFISTDSRLLAVLDLKAKIEMSLGDTFEFFLMRDFRASLSEYNEEESEHLMDKFCSTLDDIEGYKSLIDEIIYKIKLEKSS